MTVKYSVYDTSGNVLRTGAAMTVESAMLQGSKPGTSVILEDLNPKTQNVDVNTGLPVSKLPLAANGQSTVANKTTIAANGVDAIRITNIPVGAKYDVYLPTNLGLVQPPDGVVNDGVLELSTTVPGIYSLKLSYQNFLDYEVTFNAN